VCSIGDSLDQFAASLRECRSGVAWFHGAAGTGYAAARAVPPIAEVHHERSLHDPVTDLALCAATQAFTQCGWLERRSFLTDAGLYIGTAFGGIRTLESGWIRSHIEYASPHAYTIPNSLANAPAARIAGRYDVLGPCLTYCSGSAASSQAIGEAYVAIRDGRLERALAGGAEACLTPGVLSAWRATTEMARGDLDDPEATCRPFSRDRAGFVLGEGAAMFAIETLDSAHRRGAPILCEVLGFGSTSAAGPIGFAHDRSLAAAMQVALDDAHLSACDIDYIAADARGTRAGDRAEARAIVRVFGEHWPRPAVSSTKAQHGHLVGASGALAVAVGIVALRERFLPATCNLREQDAQLGDLDFVPNAPRLTARVRRVLCNAFSFGDANAVLVLARSPIDPAPDAHLLASTGESSSREGCPCQRP
jgi:3-oxoacyl-(acyl-carrier-protein) synthase